MDLNKNYYLILGIDKDSNQQEIKKRYRGLSKTHHPDKGGDEEIFKNVTEAYSVLSEVETKKTWDKLSPFGKNYQKISVFKNLNNQKVFTPPEDETIKQKKSVEDLNIHLEVDFPFKGSVEYERWVMCPECKGTGYDASGKIVIKDQLGNIIKTFESDDGCDFCEGTGKNIRNETCLVCQGKGISGSVKCEKCSGGKRILGKQKLSKLKFPEDKNIYKIESMGNSSVYHPGKSGHLFLIKKQVIE